MAPLQSTLCFPMNSPVSLLLHSPVSLLLQTESPQSRARRPRGEASVTQEEASASTEDLQDS